MEIQSLSVIAMQQGNVPGVLHDFTSLWIIQAIDTRCQHFVNDEGAYIWGRELVHVFRVLDAMK